MNAAQAERETMRRLHGEIVDVDELTCQDHEAMYRLMTRHYENLARHAFEADLRDKTWVIRLVDPSDGALCGFSTQSLMSCQVDGRSIRALFSGDTIVRREDWGRHPLAGVWGQLALWLIDRHADDELYWFLISKGYKTYRFLPVFFYEYFPRAGHPTLPWARRAIDALATARFPRSYDQDTGIIRAAGAGCRLRAGVAPISTRRLQDPHVRYFAERNPGHARGDELCCLAPLTRDNFKPAAYRVMAQVDLPQWVS